MTLSVVAVSPSSPSTASLVHLPVRPRTRGDCADAPRPCPWLGCRHHLLIGVISKHGEVRAVPAPGRPSEPLEEWTTDQVARELVRLEHTCALDVARLNPDGLTLEQVATALGGGLTRERIRQIEDRALERLTLAARKLEGEEPRR